MDPPSTTGVRNLSRESAELVLKFQPRPMYHRLKYGMILKCADGDLDGIHNYQLVIAPPITTTLTNDNVYNN